MMERITSTDGVVFYRSSLLAATGAPHGFSTRIGGISREPFHSLNLGNPNGCAVQDLSSQIAANYVRLHAAIGLGRRERVYVHQIHADQIATARAGQPFDCSTKADGIVCDDASRVASVRTADCVPVLLASADRRTVAAVHAGWRGVVAGVLIQAVRAVRELRSEGTPLVAAIGPAISFDAFEAGPEVAAEFATAFGADAAQLLKPSARPGKAMVDLRGALHLQLRRLEIAHTAIDVSDSCTVRDSDEFFSHRRDNGVTGRMAALIGPAT